MDPFFQQSYNKLYKAMHEIIPEDLKRECSNMDHQMMLHACTMSGRQVWWIACKRIFSDPRDDSTLHYLDIFNLKLEHCKGKVHKFLSFWNSCLSQIEDPPKESVLEAVLKRQLIKAPELRKPLDLYNIMYAEGNYQVQVKLTVEH